MVGVFSALLTNLINTKLYVKNSHNPNIIDTVSTVKTDVNLSKRSADSSDSPISIERIVTSSFETTVLRKGPAKDTTNGTLVLTLVADEDSYGFINGKQRKFKDYLKMIEQIKYPDVGILGILVSNIEEYNRIINVIKYDEIVFRIFDHVKVIYRDLRLDTKLTRITRKLPEYQRLRRGLLARLRNYLLNLSLNAEKDVLWIDSDMIYVPIHALELMRTSNLDIITTRCIIQGQDYEYDLNTWIGNRKQPPPNYYEENQDDSFFEPGPVENEVVYLDAFEFTRKRFIQVDSVGGTFLYVKADVHRDGAIFPSMYLVGTTWQFEGYDAIETEGLCLMARHLGYQCWGMPHIVSIHAPE